MTTLLLSGSNVSPLTKVVCFPDTAGAIGREIINIPVLDNDLDGAPLLKDPATVRVTTAPTNGTATALASGVITYQANIGFVGTDTFQYIVKDTGGVDAIAPATVTVTVTAASQFDAYSLDGSADSPYTDRWATWIGTGGSITSITGGVRVRAGVTGGGDGVAVQLWNKTLFAPTDGTTLRFRLKRIDDGLGTAVTYPAMLFYWAQKGDGTTGHPTDPSSWTGATAATRWETNCDGFRMSIDGRDGTAGIAGNLEAQIRVRKQNRTVAGVSILGPTVTGPFILAQNVAFDVTLTCVGGRFTASVTKVSDGTVLGTVTDIDTQYDTPIQGYVGIRAMETCEFEITGYEVSAAVNPAVGGFQNEVVNVQASPVITNCATAAQLQTYLDGYQDTGRIYKVPGNHRVVLTGNIIYDLAGDITIKGAATNGPTVAKPWILCCDGDANRLNPRVGFQINVQGPSVIVWGLKFVPNKAAVTRTGRLSFNGGNTNCKVQRCEVTKWMPDNLGAQAGTNGHAISFVGAGSDTLVERCYFHDPGDWGQGEKNFTAGDAPSLRIFVRQIGRGDGFQANITISKCLFASTILKPIAGHYPSGQADLLESGGNGPRYDATTNGGFTILDSIFDATGEGGPPIGFTGYPGTDLGGDVDTKAEGVVDMKISGMTLIGNTFMNFTNRGVELIKDVDLRFGERGVVKQCYFEKASFGAAGGKHHVISNKFGNKAELKLYNGNAPWNDYNFGVHQPADNVTLQDNAGTATGGVGTSWDPDLGYGSATNPSGAPDGIVNATNLKFVGAHTGVIKLNNRHAAYNVPAGFNVSYIGGAYEMQTTFSTTRIETQLDVPTGPLGRDKVGPFS